MAAVTNNEANAADSYLQAEFERLRAQDQIDSKIYTTAWGILGNAADVEDAHQDTLVKAWEHFAEFSLSSQLDFNAWVGRIARNTCFDALRSRRRLAYRTTSLNRMILNQKDGDETPNEIADKKDGPAELLLKSEISQDLRAALTDIPEIFRFAVLRVDALEMSYQEAADAGGCKIETLKTRLNRGRGMLRQRYNNILSRSQKIDTTQTSVTKINRKHDIPGPK